MNIKIKLVVEDEESGEMIYSAESASIENMVDKIYQFDGLLKLREKEAKEIDEGENNMDEQKLW